MLSDLKPLQASQFGLKKSPLSFAGLNKHLSQSYASSEHSDPPLGHEYIFLIPDRSLSPAGARKLKDLRCQGFGGTPPWPSPGVYTIPELAKRLVSTFQGTDPSIKILESASLATKALVSQHIFQNYSLNQISQHLSDIAELPKLGLTLEDTKDALRFLEQNNTEPELKKESAALLFWIQNKGQLADMGYADSEWDFVSAAIEILSHKKTTLAFWQKLTERNPFFLESKNTLNFLVPLYRGLYPLEILFLKSLTQNAPNGFSLECIECQELEIHGASFIQQITWEKSFSKCDSILWAFSEEKPGPLEMTALLPEDTVVDYEESPTELLCSQTYRNILARIENHSQVDNLFLLDLIALLSPELKSRPEILTSLKNRMTQTAPEEVLNFLWPLGLYEKVQTPPHTFFHNRLSPRGATFLSFDDLPFACMGPATIWSHPQALEELCDPHSKSTLRKRPFSPSFTSFLNSCGYTLPDPQSEALCLMHLIHELKNKITFFEGYQKSPSLLPKQRNIVATSTALPNKHSPSSIEAYLQCPHRYYLERLKKLRHSEDYDSLDISALGKGQWIHKVLELFLRTPQWTDPYQNIASLLKENLLSSFQNQMSASYQKVLEGQIPHIAKLLTLHIEDFESPLQKYFPQRILHLESSLSAQFDGLDCFGKVDRIDETPEGLLLWDYKTGEMKSKATSLIKKGKIQWFLYKNIAEQHFKKPVIGGGYLNPLIPSKSKLYLIENKSPSFLVTLLSELEHSCETLNDLDSLNHLLKNQLDLFKNGLAKLDFTPKPQSSSLCQTCSVADICGRPFLMNQETTNLEGDLNESP